jgi:membrane protein YdbS with pleckstrin-like domain
MPFPRELLRPDEELILDTKPHWWFITPASIALAASLLFGVIVLAAGPGGTVGQGVNILAGIAVLASLAFFAHRYAGWVSTNFVVTSDRVVYRSGIVAKTGVEIPVDKINTVFFNQRVFERMLGLGDIRIESASTDGASVFEDIPKPSAVQNIIYGVIDAKSDSSFDRVGQATADAVSKLAGTGTAPLSMPEQLEKLHELLQRGAITQAEYDAQKARLLGGGAQA